LNTLRPRHPNTHGTKPAAFTIVEVAMALGILSFALFSLMALVPTGLNQFRGAVNATVGAQISQRVITDAQQTEFDAFIRQAETTTPDFFVLPIRYFDEQGTETTVAAREAVYQVRVRGSIPGPAEIGAGGGAFTSLPAGRGTERFRPRDSIFLTVQIVNRPHASELPVDERQLWVSKEGPISTYTTVIARNGFTAAGR
jgi:uncharacterized protein (TIGR02598 family)